MAQVTMARALGILVPFFCLGSVATAAAADDDSRERQEFDKFIAQFGKTYSVTEKESRFETFRKNLAHIGEHNAGGHSFQLALNEHSDLDASEFGRTMGLNASQGSSVAAQALEGPWGGLPRLGTLASAGSAMPDSVDWRGSGCMTPVLDQGQCGGCWSFSATAAIAAAWQLATGTLPLLSQQQLLDCSSSYGNRGCEGGNMAVAFLYAREVPFCTAASYPYEAGVGTCRQDTCQVALPAGAILGYRRVQPNDEEALMAAVAQQPVSVGIEAEQTPAFRLYKSGVLSGRVCGDRPNHGVLLVGYGSERGQDYWLVKNSWGPTWGEEGYFKLARGPGTLGPLGNGLCAILSMPSIPAVDGGPAKGTPSDPPPATPPAPAPTPAPTPGEPSGYYSKPPCREGEGVYMLGAAAVCVPPCSHKGEQCPDGGRCNLRDRSWMGFWSHKRYCTLPCGASYDCPGEAICVSHGRGTTNSGNCMHLIMNSGADEIMGAAQFAVQDTPPDDPVPNGVDGPGRRLRQDSSPPDIFA